MRAAVVGGGIVGLASSYFLAERGVHVTVYEKGTIGAGASERSLGGIRTQFSSRVNVELSLASLEVWEDFEARFGVDLDHRQAGYLLLTREATTAEGLREDVEMQRALGAPADLLTPAAATEHCPELDPGPFAAATYCPRDGFADPHLAVQGFARGAREAGVDVRTGTAVTDVRRDGDRVVGVRTAGGAVDADVVVNAAGPWARRVNRMAGVDLPVAPRRRQMAVVEPEEPLPEDVPLTIDLDTGSHFRPERDGAALVGGHFADTDPDADPERYDRTMDLDWAATALDRAADYAGYFGPESRLRGGWAGLYAVTPDHLAIVDEVRPGYVTAIGFSGHGFQHAPATGQLVADLAVDGEASLLDADPLSADRFEGGEPTPERNVA